MPQYLLNATAIWLLSLMLFDFFLRKENYHGYNRFYLLFTFLLGVFLPLWQWQEDSTLFQSSLQRPMERIITAKQNIVTTAELPLTKINWEAFLWYIYFAGIVVSSLLLIVEVVKIIRLYNTGSRSREGSCIIIETGKEHSPFSLFNQVFVSRRDNYSQQEWDMLVAHEQMHGLLLHFIDVLLMQAARIVFWFHPLVYIYNACLMMQHEYQADRVSAAKPQFYGQFLIAQALLQNAPSLTHSFNRSPIKNRIVMLTRTSSFAAKTKMLVFIPLALVCIICFSKNGFSHKFDRTGNIVTYRGNKIELSEPGVDTVMITDPVTGKEITQTTRKPARPITINGKPILEKTDQQPYFTGNYYDIRDYLLKNLKKQLSVLDDGYYSLNISNIVVDENGKVVYFEYSDMKRYKSEEEKTGKNAQPATSVVTKNAAPDIIVTSADTSLNGGHPLGLYRASDPADFAEINKSAQKEIFNKVCELMEKVPPYKPATLGGRKVTAMVFCATFWNNFQIKGHKLVDPPQFK